MHQYIGIQYKKFPAESLAHEFRKLGRNSYVLSRTLIKPDIISIFSEKYLNNLIENMIRHARKSCLALR